MHQVVATYICTEVVYLCYTQQKRFWSEANTLLGKSLLHPLTRSTNGLRVCGFMLETLSVSSCKILVFKLLKLFVIVCLCTLWTVWKYDGEKDSVLQVTKEAYINCNTTNPAASYSNGDTKVKLERSGPFFFISGFKSNCVQGEKLHIVVMSSRGGFFTGGSAPSPAPSPALLEAQAVPPANGSASSLTSRIGVLAFVGLAIVLL
ncbi:unnamed protein product [Brassica oleracea]|uniref:(rape) hypothetical protein n=1 Tax=Brassica napus TaxID=3708 RepID=A0A816REH1_BRANA|nr:unnamed protein product [Brassica napus]